MKRARLPIRPLSAGTARPTLEPSTHSRLDAAGLERAERHLASHDPAIGALVASIGRCRLAERQRRNHFTALVSALVSQQLSTRAAATIFGRVTALVPEGDLSSHAVFATVSDAELRAAGLSRAKVAYLRDLCAWIADGRLDLPGLESLPDEAVVAQLTRVKGFGRWTAEMFLIFRLARPDVLPVGDLGIVKAVARLYGLRSRPGPERLEGIAEPWRPYRTVACWYLWQSLNLEPPIVTRPKARASPPGARSRARWR